MSDRRDSTWPVRHLLAADLSRNLDRRNLAKPVLDRLVLDDMEADGGWTATDCVAMSYTTDHARSGTRSLRFSTELRNDDYLRFSRRRNGSFSGGAVLFDGEPFAATMQRSFSPPQDWTPYNRLSLWVYVHPTSNPVSTLAIEFLCDGASAGPADAIASHYVSDLLAGEWNHIAWEFPEIARDRVSKIVVFQPVFGLPVKDADPGLTYDFDEVCVERVDAERVDGWAVTRGRIAYSHIGYQPGAVKRAVAPDGPPAFDLLDAESGNGVATFDAAGLHNRRGDYSVLDFSSFAVPGTYRLRHGSSITEPFPIAQDVWERLVEAVLNAFYGLRCGIEIPDAHDACHLDVVLTHRGERRLAAGGWHDAANLTQAPNNTYLSIVALLELHESLRSRNSPLTDRALEEALWGLDWLLRVRFGPGLQPGYLPISYYTDSTPGTLDDVDLDDLVERRPFTATLAALAAARAVRALSAPDAARLAEKLTGDSSLASRLLQAARDDYADVTIDVAPPDDAPPLDINQPSWRDRIGFLTLAAVELYRVTSEPTYAADAARFARWLVSTQERWFVDGIPITGYFYEDAGRTRLVHEFHQGFEDSGLLAFAALCEEFPGHPDWMDWYAGLVLFAKYFCAQGSRASAPFDVVPAAVWRRADLDAAPAPNPIGDWIATMGPSPLFPTAPTREQQKAGMLQMFEESAVLGPDHRLRVFPLWYDNVRHGATNVQLSKTIGLAAAARAMKSPDLSDLAARQLQWIVGANPFSRSLIYGVGHDYWQNFAVALPNLVGGLSVGMNSYRDDSPAWGNNAVFPYKEIWIFSMCRLAHTLAHVVASDVAPGDPTSALELELIESTPTGAQVVIDLRVAGSGRHTLVARLFNARLSGLPFAIDLGAEGQLNVELTLDVEHPSMPWLLIVVPDDRLDSRVETTGTVTPGKHSIVALS